MQEKFLLGTDTKGKITVLGDRFVYTIIMAFSESRYLCAITVLWYLTLLPHCALRIFKLLEKLAVKYPPDQDYNDILR